MDITQELSEIENAMRDFIAVQLLAKFGKEWINQCGVSGERIKIWE